MLNLFDSVAVPNVSLNDIITYPLDYICALPGCVQVARVCALRSNTKKRRKQDMCDCVRCLMSFSVNIAPISQYWSQPETEWQLGYLFSNVSEENMEHKIGYKVILWVDTTLIFESLLTTFDRKSIVKYLLFVTRVCRSKLLVPTEENH